MDQQSNPKKVEVEPWPKADDKEFWKDAQNDVWETKEISCPKDKHVFAYSKKPSHVQCATCGAGYILSPGWYVDKGHIYSIGNERVI